MVKLTLQTVMCKLSSLIKNNVMFTGEILYSCFLGSMVYMYVAYWMLNSGYGIKFFIDCDGNYSDDNDDDIDESHNDG